MCTSPKVTNVKICTSPKVKLADGFQHFNLPYYLAWLVDEQTDSWDGKSNHLHSYMCQWLNELGPKDWISSESEKSRAFVMEKWLGFAISSFVAEASSRLGKPSIRDGSRTGGSIPRGLGILWEGGIQSGCWVHIQRHCKANKMQWQTWRLEVKRLLRCDHTSCVHCFAILWGIVVGLSRCERCWVIPV